MKPFWLESPSFELLLILSSENLQNELPVILDISYLHSNRCLQECPHSLTILSCLSSPFFSFMIYKEKILNKIILLFNVLSDSYFL